MEAVTIFSVRDVYVLDHQNFGSRDAEKRSDSGYILQEIWCWTEYEM